MERSGKWITKFADNGWMDWTCSECGWTWNDDVHVNLSFNYCPNCGAKMNSNYLPQKTAYALYSGTAKMRVFDWEKAARLIKSYTNNSIFKIDSVTAGLKDDLEWTGACIFEKGKPNHDARPYLASIWATPIIVFYYDNNDELGEIEIECWKYMDETEWNEYTVWPQVAIDILEGVV